MRSRWEYQGDILPDPEPDSERVLRRMEQEIVDQFEMRLLPHSKGDYSPVVHQILREFNDQVQRGSLPKSRPYKLYMIPIEEEEIVAR